MHCSIPSPSPCRNGRTGTWLAVACGVVCAAAGFGSLALADQPAESADRSPVDLVLTEDEQWLVTANQTSGTLSLVAVESGQVVDEAAAGERPAAVALAAARRVLVSNAYSGDLVAFDLSEGRLRRVGGIALGFEPRGIAVAANQGLAYVALSAAAKVAVVDLGSWRVLRQIDVGLLPRQVALSRDGSRLAVGTSGDRSVSVVDTQSAQMVFQQQVEGINLEQMVVSDDGQYVYFPWAVYRHNPITERNIRLGWVLATRIARVRLDSAARREAISLDVPGAAVSDPHGLALSPDGRWIVASAGGTHELLVYRQDALRFQDFGGPGDLIERDLIDAPDRFYRVALGGRPTNIRMSRDGRRVFVANYLLNAVQVVDLERRQCVETIHLGGPEAPSLARRGEAIFLDGRRSLDQWYSCHTCHYEGGGSPVPMDTRNDGTMRTFKTVPPLHHVSQTGPWTWHGWQQDLDASIRKSLTETMLGPVPEADEIQAVRAWLDTLALPPNPYRRADGGLSEAAERGRAVFESETAGCSTCHRGELFTDGQIHDVGLGSDKDVYQGFNTPMLLGTYRKTRWLHDGRARSLEEVLSGPHDPAKVTGLGPLSPQELADLVEYVKSL